MKTDRLKQHLDAAYRVAQAITLNPRAAAELVERAFRNAHAQGAESWPDDEVRDRLIRNVLAAHRSAASLSPTPATAAPEVPTTPEGTAFRAMVARETIDRLLPTALALLPDRLRTLLILIETENMSIPDAARVFDMGAEQVLQDRDAAHRMLLDSLLRSAGEAEREVLTEQLRDDWIRQALLRHARTRFVPPPPTLVLPETEAVYHHEQLADADERPRERRAVASGRPRRILYATVLVLVAGLVGYVASALLEPKPDSNLVTLSARNMNAVTADFESDSAAEIESFVRDEGNRRIVVPDIEQTSLIGAGFSEIVDGVRVPVILYRDRSSNERMPVFVYSYALLDRHADRLTLERDVMQQIQDERHFDLHDLGDTRILIWRNRDEIFVAATHGDASDLQDRIRPSS
ncbi:MAG TPA: hypothetical protein VF190_13010 [Rhodothermales bacterium]